LLVELYAGKTLLDFSVLGIPTGCSSFLSNFISGIVSFEIVFEALETGLNG